MVITTTTTTTKMIFKGWMTKVRLPHGSLTTILHPIRNREGGNETRTSHGDTRGATTGAKRSLDDSDAVTGHH